MTKLETHELESVERARKLLLAKFFDSAATDKLRKKEAVRQLLGTIIAVREAGMSFDEIATIFSEAGLVLNANTLRLYFYQLKAQADIAAHEKAHADQVARTRSQLESDDRQRFSQDALTEAQAVAKRKRSPHFPEPPPEVPPAAAPSAMKPQKAEKQKPARPLMGVAPPPPTHALGAAISRAGEGSIEPPAEPSKPVPAEAPPVAPRTEGIGPTIEEAQQAGASIQGVRPDLRENVVLHQGRLYYESGEAFDATLSKAQAYLIRQTGKIIAPTVMTSTKDFVTMPTKL